jgi:hypothetical protein
MQETEQVKTFAGIDAYSAKFSIKPIEVQGEKICCTVK